MVEAQLAKLNIGAGEPANLYAPVEYALEAGGKRIRPVLALMACNLFGDDIQPALIPAVALEVFHNFTLLHDDVMDHADIRRNRPTVHRRWSENVAILSGDAMQVLAYRYLCRAKTELLPALLEAFSAAALEVCEGQQYDMDFERRTDVSIGEYLNMIRLKTAALLAASLKIGALCGGAEQQNTEALYRFGVALGLTFQIRDDLLDVYADPRMFGKATGGDILSGKKTFLLLSALEKADSATRRQLLELIGNGEIADGEKIRRATAIYDLLDVRRTAEQAMETYSSEAMEHLQAVKIPDASRKAELKKTAAMLLKRTK
jgi:geranylgeranyl diphosphate synthase type II